MALITEIAPDVYRISTHISAFDLQFNQFLVKDDEPLLYHTGLRAIHPEVREAVESILDPSSLRWIGFSHFESDECGTLNQWLEAAPQAEAVCSMVAKAVSVDDFAVRPARALADDEVLSTGAHRLRFLQTPHVPHAWESGLMFEETSATLLCSDLFHHGGDVEPTTESDVVDRARKTVEAYQKGPLANYLPYTPLTDGHLQRLADLKPRACATMHGSTFVGDGQSALRELAALIRDVFGQAPE
jgi:flavorubredoxin